MDSLSKRLNYILELKGVKKAELARQVGVTPQTIQYLCASNSQTSRFTFEIASALGISFKWLATGEGDIEQNIAKKITATREIPVYDFQAIKEHFIAHKSYPNDASPQVIVASVHEKIFAAKLPDNAMSPRLDKGSIVILAETSQVNNGEYALVYIKDINEVVFREVSIDDKGSFLIPFNNKVFNIIKLQSEDKFLGKLIEARWS